MTKNAIGNRLKQIRLNDLGWSAAKLAAEVGVSQASISLYESNRREPSAKFLLRLHTLGFDTGWILAGEGSMRRALTVVSLDSADPAVFAPKSNVQHLIKSADGQVRAAEAQQQTTLPDPVRADIVAELVSDSLLANETEINAENLARFVRFAAQKSA